MSNTQEQSLDEDVVFLPLTESCPEFLHCERERQALERLMSAGPEAFYSCLRTEHSGCFLSPEEVSQMIGWTQDYHVSQVQVGREQDGEGGSWERQDFSVCYFPTYSDVPPPCLELGWPEKGSWMGRECVAIHTSPPANGHPPIREVIRRYLQGASQVIAIVTDRLTDGAVIGDLHHAASRGVPVYIILNQRSVQENFTPNRLRHSNMQVRVLGGKTFRSREGRMVVGEMKDNFLLVDLETVIHGSYSLTWTDAHLHRQLITVLSGPAVESFDKEFRILFAASLPIQDTWKIANNPVDVSHQLKHFPDLHFPKHLPLEPVSISPPPPPPPVESPLDWEALGVVQRDPFSPGSPVYQHEDIMAVERPLQTQRLFEKHTPITDEFSHNRDQFLDQGSRVRDNATPMINHLPDEPTNFKIEHKIERAIYKQRSKERSIGSDDRKTVIPEEKQREENSRQNVVPFSSAWRRAYAWTDNILEEKMTMDGGSSREENTASSRRPLRTSQSQAENLSSLSDIMKRLQPQQSFAAQHRRGSKTTVSDLSRSMVDLSIHNTEHEERGIPVPRLKASLFDQGHVTPAFALMKKRNDEIKSMLFRTKSFLPSPKPRNFSLGLQLDFRRTERDRDFKEARRSKETTQEQYPPSPRKGQ
ncbi:uncharacterized protein fam83e [Diretmus argenteus]